MTELAENKPAWCHDMEPPYTRREGITTHIAPDPEHPQTVTLALLDGEEVELPAFRVHAQRRTSVKGCPFCYGAARHGGPRYPS